MLYQYSWLIRLSLLSLFLSILLSSLSCGKETAGETKKASYTPPSSAPTPIETKIDDYLIPMLGGGLAQFTHLVGKNKVVLVNVWATWCGPCRAEIPELVSLQRDLKDQGFEVIGLTIEDPKRDEELVRKFVKDLSINYKIGFSPTEIFTILNSDNPRGPVPQSYIFDRQGRLIDSVKGPRPDFRVWVEGAVKMAMKKS
ncbi:MAG TPA: TlpA disulfide reductase family protein [Blastocatellia bacterium]|nr:TlpA disulfide reductase family protein [Blastocatellia bacterium]